jgi:protein-disulfide isomerase-like protein with CxxC motif
MTSFSVTWDYRCPFARNAHEHLAVGLAAGAVVRDQYPDLFLDAHVALFAARHDEGLDLRAPEIVGSVLERVGVPGDKVLAEVATGAPVQQIRQAHEHAVGTLEVFGVPTFIVGDRAVFVRLMSRPEGDAGLAQRTIQGVVDLFESQPDLNEFKHTSLSR